MILWVLFKSSYKEGPRLGFWILLLFNLIPYLSRFPIYLVVLILVLTIAPLIISFFSWLKKAETLTMEKNVKESISKTKKQINIPNSKLLIINLPTNRDLKRLNRYFDNYSKEWASDGIIKEINYYLEIEGDELTKDVQAYIYSGNRKETLTKYFPSKSEKIEIERIPVGQYPPIYEFSKWRENAVIAIEKCSGDIDISDKVRLQIGPSKDALHINFYLEIKNRNSTRRFTLKNEILEEQ